ncbi:hypothetical protein [Cellulomonas oligotrophica]|uniref:Lipoprotein n=1 Tax=Cellulomonas oligotrophica TaxID=931536 RepID=A0A7Y9FF01_9CELL|nr:hypothetical protein [Cellulomonas oligotrophica]NYD85918.1 hypothetical protein [Cellulomonas oligotrophica]GIG31074.1 hypothetical protein Col01nite_02330 [Cellulomonas oligotrophica]
MTRPPARSAVTAAALGGACVLAILAGCVAPGPAPVETAATGAPPGPVAVEVAQARTDRVARVVELQVRNDGSTDLTVTEGRLTAGSLDGDVVTLQGRDVPAGATRRLRAALPAPRCAGDPTTVADLDLTVALDVVTADGTAATLQVEPTDEDDDLLRVRGEDCAAAAVAAGLEMALDETLTTRTLDGAPVADVTLRVRAVPGGPRVQLTQVLGTTLLRAPDASSWPLDVDTATLGADAEPVTLPVVPARCDLHAIAEDKRGTVLGVRALVDGVEQPVVYVVSPPDLLGALHRFVVDTCTAAADP